MRCGETEKFVRMLVTGGMEVMLMADTYNFGGKTMTMWTNGQNYVIMVSDDNTSCITLTGPIKSK